MKKTTVDKHSYFFFSENHRYQPTAGVNVPRYIPAIWGLKSCEKQAYLKATMEVYENNYSSQ